MSEQGGYLRDKIKIVACKKDEMIIYAAKIV